MTLTHFPFERVEVLGGGREELAERLLMSDLDLTAAAALVLHEADAYYVLDYDELRDLDRFWTLRTRLGTIPDAAADVVAMIEGELDLVATEALTVAPGEEPDRRAVEITAGRVEGVWAPSSEALETFGGRRMPSIDVEAVEANEEGPEGARVLRRTPHLDAPNELDVSVGARFGVKVWTDTAPPRDVEESEEVVIELPSDVDAVDLGVLLRTSPHFRVDGPYFLTLHVERERTDSEPVRFEVEVVKLDEPGPAAIDATLLWEGRECGLVRLTWTWPDGRAKVVAPAPGAVSVTTGVGRPDLSVSVRSPTNDERQQWSVCAPNLPDFEDWTAPVEWSSPTRAENFIADALARFVDRTMTSEERSAELRRAGREFWKAAPEVLHDAVWALIDKEQRDGKQRRPSIYVATDDPLLPWELMLPTREKEDLTPDDRQRPLGVEFAVGRRLRGDRRPPPELLPVRDSLLIAATYDEGRELDSEDELEVLVRHFGGRRLAEASKEYFDEHLGEQSASLLHFVCHGSAGQGTERLFLDHDKAYSSGDVRDSSGFKALCARDHPIVFLNACDAGQANLTLAPGGSGFPQAFTELGARAVIAPLWPVSMLNAPKVAVAVYSRAAAEPDRALADILAELRDASYSGSDDEFDDSWAAYALFGDPCAPLRRETDPRRDREDQW